MAKIPEWMKSEGFTNEELNELACPNGSFTCGLLEKLGMKTRCNLCKKNDA